MSSVFEELPLGFTVLYFLQAIAERQQREVQRPLNRKNLTDRYGRRADRRTTFLTAHSSARAAIEGMRLRWQVYYALLALDASARKIPVKISSGDLSTIATRIIDPLRSISASRSSQSSLMASDRRTYSNSQLSENS